MFVNKAEEYGMSQEIRIGIVGLGFMGMTHFEAAKRLRGAKVTAIATRDPKKRAGDWSSIQGNFGPRGSSATDLTGIKTYASAEELWHDPEIDLVDICLPTDQHEATVLAALQSGKDVLVEKPIAVEQAAAERMVAAAGEYDRMLLVGHVLPFFPEFAFAVEAVKSGRYGKLLGAFFRRVICPPDWSADMSDFRKLGGWGIDLHIHDNHLIRLLCGQPQRVFSRGMLAEGFVNHVATQYVFDEPLPSVTAISGGIAAGALKFAHSFELILEKATIQFDAGTYGSEWVVNRPLTVLTADEVQRPTLNAGTEWCAAFTDELQAAVESIRNRVPSPMLSSAAARDALAICYAEAESIASGREAVVVQG